MQACKFIEKGIYSRRFAENKRNFSRYYFRQQLPETYLGFLQTSKIKKFATIAEVDVGRLQHPRWSAL